RSRALLTLAGALALVVLGAVISGKRRTPSACPYALRLFLQLPRPLMPRDRVLRMLAPAPGQRVLEVGPGVGYYSLDLAAALAPGGVLDLLDIQEPMLQTVMQRATERGVTGISPHLGDAQASPFPDGTFDAVLCVATLGEIPDPARALHEMHRVLKPTGRLVIAEGQPDPHMVTRSALADLADASGFTLAAREGNPFGYVARLEPRVASYTATVTRP
ncbi:MAG: methyltransferase domain-containing protein, partial [Thermomicrobiales bacterium]